MSKVRAYCSASDHLIRKIFSGVCRDSLWFEEYLKIIEVGDYFFEWTFIFCVFHPSYMPGSHPLWANFAWPIEIRVHCKNQSSSISRVRDIDHNESRSWRGIVHTQAFLRKHAISLDRVIHLISGVDHPIKLVCCPLLHAILSTNPITGTQVMSDEHNLLPCISRVRAMLELWFLQWTCISMGQTKVGQRGCDPGMLEGWKTRKMNVHSKKLSLISIIFRYSSNQWLPLHTPEKILRIRWSEAEL